MKYLLVILSSFILNFGIAQDVNVLLKEADNFERQVKEPEALDKYKQVLAVEPANLKALVKAAELHASIGGRQNVQCLLVLMLLIILGLKCWLQV